MNPSVSLHSGAAGISDYGSSAPSQPWRSLPSSSPAYTVTSPELLSALEGEEAKLKQHRQLIVAELERVRQEELICLEKIASLAPNHPSLKEKPEESGNSS